MAAVPVNISKSLKFKILLRLFNLRGLVEVVLWRLSWANYLPVRVRKEKKTLFMLLLANWSPWMWMDTNDLLHAGDLTDLLFCYSVFYL